MKKCILLLSLILIGLISYSQESYEKTILINSSTIKIGGDYILIPATLGYVIEIERMELKYDFNSTEYTVSGTDTLGIKSQTKDGLKFVILIEDESLTATTKYISYANDSNSNCIFGNSIILSIPPNKFTLGDSDIYIKLKYKLIR